MSRGSLLLFTDLVILSVTLLVAIAFVLEVGLCVSLRHYEMSLVGLE